MEAITRLQTETNEVYEQIQMFLRKKGLKSKETERNYEKDIKDFFKIVKEKNLNELVTKDLQTTLDDFDRFILESVDSEKYENATINRKVQSIRSMLKYFHAKKLVEDISFFSEIERLPEHVKGYSAFTVDEVFQLAEFALNSEREKRQVKYFLILFALDTCIRKAAILNLKWSDFEIKEDGVIVNAVDKGNKDYRSKISLEFYESLLSLKSSKSENDKVFDIAYQTVDRMMTRLVKKLETKGNRYLVFHSIRKSGATFQWRITQDPLQVKKVLNHSSFNTSLRYIEEDDLGAVGAVSSRETLDFKIFDKLSREELLQLIKKSKKDIQIVLAIEAKKMFNK